MIFRDNNPGISSGGNTREIWIEEENFLKQYLSMKMVLTLDVRSGLSSRAGPCVACMDVPIG